jgi:chromate transporter
VLFAYGAHALKGSIGTGLLHGLKLAAVAVIAQAVVGMARTLCPDRQRASIATLAMVLILYSSSTITQIGAILLSAVAGTLVCRTSSAVSTLPMVMPISRRIGVASLAIFLLLLFGLPLALSLDAAPGLALFNAFYRSGALVFGGGHVVLPLLRDALVTPGWISDDTFLTGYGAAQAVPGPLFTFAAYLGVFAAPARNGAIGAALGIIGIFLPGMLLLVGTLPFWGTLRARAEAQAAMRGISAAVVGLLGAALYNPAWTNSVHTPADLSVALMGFVLLTMWHSRPLLVVVMSALSGIVLGLFQPP